MPVIVPEDAWSLWLDPELEDPGELQGLLAPSDDVALRIQAVRPLVNNVRNDGPELLEPVDLAAERERARDAEPAGLFD
jgi:putative SOS response-associated peptidase YedK